MSSNGDPRAVAAARVSELAGTLALLPQAMGELEQLGGDPMRAFLDGLPPGFIGQLVQEQPMMGSIFLALGVPLE